MTFSYLFLICIFAKLSLIDYANKEIWRVAQINMLYILKMIMLSDNYPGSEAWV